MDTNTNYDNYTQLDLWGLPAPTLATQPAPSPAPAKKRLIKPVPAASESGDAILAIAEQLEAIADTYMSLREDIYDRVGGCGLCSTSCWDRDKVCEACEVCAASWAINDAALAAHAAWVRHREHARDIRLAASWARDLPPADKELLRQSTVRIADSLTRRDTGWLDLWPALQDPQEVKVLIKCLPHLSSLPIDESSALDLVEAPNEDSPLTEQELVVLRTRARRLFELPVEDCLVPTGVFARSWVVTGHEDVDAWVLADQELALAVQAARRGLAKVDLGAEYDDPCYVREILVELGILRSR